MNAISNTCFLNAPTDRAANADNNNQVAIPTMLGRNEMHAIFSMCRKNQWNSVLRCVQTNPQIPVTSMIMDNHISTTILHQAITSKGNTELRAKVIRTILEMAPQAAAIKNGYGSLPLHVIAQRNTKMDAPTKELLITELVLAYKGALLQPGGVGKRTPLHIIFTDYISPRVTELMIQYGPQACFMRDKKGYLAAHVACSRHCSPEKLRMLLAVHPESLVAKTNDGQTLLSLAIGTATRSHPNYALIDAIRTKLDGIGVGISVPRGIAVSPRRRMASVATTSTTSKSNRYQQKFKKALTRRRANAITTASPKYWDSSVSLDAASLVAASAGATAMSTTAAATITTDSVVESYNHHHSNVRKVTDKSTASNDDDDDDGKEPALEEDPVSLLLHFSRHTDGKTRVEQV
mmetsp:Transcript_37831/g.91744  ORF Transcript_37831/g.91744 Transcript_37831/m.91744 type:complete len:406 (+) Transcript_37831:768-1985(+)|eukprot:CAMPEP_0113645904 /NCGR_PEP_ID=MMETSP0017_2-20120614/24216_1 /TAXON_ID=2856 /ORGANISM="Cylindrotheca closterium" /LENGTH=405 /DNA_ID=CAMNT_0000557705 /DNA_START=685 /DNA_END=1902 /DNA_ORIENTATION=+ /assembly_acc=CAM_ASM_000147